MSLVQALVVGFMAAVSGAAAAAFITGFFQRPKTRAEAQDLIAKAGATMDARYEKWIEQLEEALQEVRLELKTVKTTLIASENKINRLKGEISRERILSRQLIAYTRLLRSEIERLGGTPPPFPTDVEDYIDLRLREGLLEDVEREQGDR